MEFKIIKPFGPSVVKVKIPEKTIFELNNYIDQIVKDKKKSLELDYGTKLVGDVTQEFVLEKDIMQKSGWADFVANCTNNWIKTEIKKNISKFMMKNSWVVRQFKNEYNPTHWHDGHISGAGFLKLPDNMGQHTQSQKTNHKQYKGGYLQLIHGSKMFACEATLSIEPKVGDLYLFPNYLMHAVFPFKDSDQERRSISFNALIDENIYNPYGKN